MTQIGARGKGPKKKREIFVGSHRITEQRDTEHRLNLFLFLQRMHEAAARLSGREHNGEGEREQTGANGSKREQTRADESRRGRTRANGGERETNNDIGHQLAATRERGPSRRPSRGRPRRPWPARRGETSTSDVGCRTFWGRTWGGAILVSGETTPDDWQPLRSCSTLLVRVLQGAASLVRTSVCGACMKRVLM